MHLKESELDDSVGKLLLCQRREALHKGWWMLCVVVENSRWLFDVALGVYELGQEDLGKCTVLFILEVKPKGDGDLSGRYLYPIAFISSVRDLTGEVVIASLCLQTFHGPPDGCAHKIAFELGELFCDLFDDLIFLTLYFNVLSLYRGLLLLAHGLLELERFWY